MIWNHYFCIQISNTYYDITEQFTNSLFLISFIFLQCLKLIGYVATVPTVDTSKTRTEFWKIKCFQPFWALTIVWEMAIIMFLNYLRITAECRNMWTVNVENLFDLAPHLAAQFHCWSLVNEVEITVSCMKFVCFLYYPRSFGEASIKTYLNTNRYMIANSPPMILKYHAEAIPMVLQTFSQ